eukprot:GSMAST32.ASY1.ANO1.1441.1 assembled CDS
MGRKQSGPDTRGLKAKAQKKASQREKDAVALAKKQKAEDASWKVGSNVTGDAKREAEAQRHADLMERRRLKKQLLEDEDEINSKAKKPKGKARKAQKNNAASLFADYKPQKKSTFGKLAKKKKKKDKPIPIHKNLNRQRAEEEARGEFHGTGIDGALGAITAAKGQGAVPDAHPERRRKAAFKAFEERRIPELRKENKGLRLAQIKQMVFKEFQKSPENPMNQV